MLITSTGSQQYGSEIITLQLLAKGEESYTMFLNSVTQLGT